MLKYEYDIFRGWAYGTVDDITVANPVLKCFETALH